MKKAEFTMAQVVGFILLLIVLGLISWFLIKTFATTATNTEDCQFLGYTCVNGENYCQTTVKDAVCKGDYKGMTCCARLKSDELYTLGTKYLDDGTNNHETVTFKNGASHTATVVSIKATEADLKIASDDPKEITVKYGEEKKVQLEMPYIIQVLPNIQKKTGGGVQVPISVRVILKQDITATVVPPGGVGGPARESIVQMLYKYDLQGTQPIEVYHGSSYAIAPQNKLIMTAQFSEPPKNCVSYLQYEDVALNSYRLVDNALVVGTSTTACKELVFTYESNPQLLTLKWTVAALKDTNECKPSATNDNMYLSSCWMEGTSSAQATFTLDIPSNCLNKENLPRTDSCSCGGTILGAADTTTMCHNDIVVDCSKGTSCDDYCSFANGQSDEICEFPNTEIEFCWEDVCGYNPVSGCKIEYVNAGPVCKPSAATVEAELQQCPLNTPVTEDCLCGAEIVLETDKDICIQHSNFVQDKTVYDCSTVLTQGCSSYCTFESGGSDCAFLEQAACQANYCGYVLGCELDGEACNEITYT